MGLFDQQYPSIMPPVAQPVPPAPNQPPPAGQNPWSAILALLGQHQQSQYNPMAEAQADVARLSGLRHDPQGDANRSYAPGTMNAGNPFANGFFNQSAGNLDQMDPRIAQSQGNTAMNQWANPGAFGPARPPTMSNSQAAGMASPAPFQISPESSAIVHGQRPIAASANPRPGFNFSALR